VSWREGKKSERQKGLKGTNTQVEATEPSLQVLVPTTIVYLIVRLGVRQRRARYCAFVLFTWVRGPTSQALSAYPSNIHTVTRQSFTMSDKNIVVVG
jgi:hypothetical protein